MTTPDSILIDVPDQFESPRLLMRCPRPGDGDTVAASVRASLAELQP